MPRKIEISYKTIIFTVVFLVSLWFLYYIKDILVQFFIAILIAAILDPVVTKISYKRIPRAVSVLLVYLTFLVIISFTFAAFIPTLINQTTSFVNNIPSLIKFAGMPQLLSDQIMREIITQLGSLPAQVSRLVISLFSNILSVVVVFVIAFYLSADREKLEKQLEKIMGEYKKEKVLAVVKQVEFKLSGWARGQFILMLVVGIAIYLGLVLLGIPFSLPLAILAGLLEAVPYIGPILSAIPAVFIGLGISPFLGLAAASLYFLVQQFENYLLVPKIMQKSTGVNPVITLLLLAVGFRLAGIVGVVIAIPLFISLRVIVEVYYKSK
ncbi:hypothetical protein A2159_00930 [Candidatus Woesebacteria bacterium RBG_13_34_9]|uniref:AI-2E family transporter n=1 Tax=Candidatus Woesebacteria bacterium RBG_13_34_9 TaxID=1802477 RepID=A0A1F7X306_9BACT|nr:MAG: hypothetical protein A2159_00930 [Candidatus Woesebacteria bacterium RBG_13_34_9]